ncbi:hypothetical protein CCACVL1_02449 [Corchorus capsularis]|uniref:Uncharacterized protein n=1 Tax=Corchorus capsularis TaxID=210143 RepID=A0A1R3K8I8_COCAP|nr:hypothetical protein CCACVL1_02449 [Corchorus capsularis]
MAFVVVGFCKPSSSARARACGSKTRLGRARTELRA